MTIEVAPMYFKDDYTLPKGKPAISKIVHVIEHSSGEEITYSAAIQIFTSRTESIEGNDRSFETFQSMKVTEDIYTGELRMNLAILHLTNFYNDRFLSFN